MIWYLKPPEIPNFHILATDIIKKNLSQLGISQNTILMYLEFWYQIVGPAEKLWIACDISITNYQSKTIPFQVHQKPISKIIKFLSCIKLFFSVHQNSLLRILIFRLSIFIFGDIKFFFKDIIWIGCAWAELCYQW